MSYAHAITGDLPFDTVAQASPFALAGEGLVVIAAVDIHAAFASKLEDEAATGGAGRRAGTAAELQR